MKKESFKLQLFANDGNAYCDFSSTAAKALAGKDILLAVFNATGDGLLAISGQQGLTINRSADSIEITSKDTDGGWKSKIAGMKEWSIDNDGLYVPNDESHRVLSEAFENGDPVCLKVVNGKTKQGMFGGLAVITDYPLEAPYDDAVTYSLTFEGMGKLVDLLLNPVEPDTMPNGQLGTWKSDGGVRRGNIRRADKHLCESGKRNREQIFLSDRRGSAFLSRLWRSHFPDVLGRRGGYHGYDRKPDHGDRNRRKWEST